MPEVLTRPGRPIVRLSAAVTLTFVLASGLAAALPLQDSRSAAPAKELAAALEGAKLDSIAAPDPGEKDVFVAALYIPGSQLLVVSAKYSAPSLLIDKLAKKEYRDAYIDLNSASIAGTKVFIMDVGADGLVARPDDDQPADSWEQGNQTTAFDGDWKKAKLSEAEYTKTFTAADERYAQILTLLTAQVKKQTSGA